MMSVKGVVSMAAALLAVGTAASAEPGVWITKELSDASAAGPKYFVSQVASDQQLINVDGQKQKATLSVRCEKQGLFVTILWPETVAGDTYKGDQVDVDVKVDDGRLRLAMMRRVDQAAIAMGKEGFKLLKDAEKGKALTVHVPDMYGGQTATFQIDGMETVYGRVAAQGCSNVPVPKESTSGHRPRHAAPAGVPTPSQP